MKKFTIITAAWGLVYAMALWVGQTTGAATPVQGYALASVYLCLGMGTMLSLYLTWHAPRSAMWLAALLSTGVIFTSAQEMIAPITPSQVSGFTLMLLVAGLFLAILKKELPTPNAKAAAKAMATPEPEPGPTPAMAKLMLLEEMLDEVLRRLKTLLERPTADPTRDQLAAIIAELQNLPPFLGEPLKGKLEEYVRLVATLKELPVDTGNVTPEALRRLGALISAANALPDTLPSPERLTAVAETSAVLSTIAAPEVNNTDVLPVFREDFENVFLEVYNSYEDPEENEFKEIFDETVTRLKKIYTELDTDAVNAADFPFKLRRDCAQWARQFLTNNWEDQLEAIDRDEWSEATEELMKLQMSATKVVEL